MTRPTHDELHLSDAARQMGMMSGEYPAQGADPKSTCIPAYTLDDSDVAYYRKTPPHSATGGSAQTPWVPPWSTFAGCSGFGFLIAGFAADLLHMPIAVAVCVILACVCAFYAYRWRN